MAEVAEPDGVVVDRVDLYEDVDEGFGAAPGVVGRELGHLLRRAQDLPVDLLHHVERRVVDVEVVAEREGGTGTWWARCRRAPCTRAPCRARWQHVAERRSPQHPLVTVVGDRVGEVRAPAGDKRRSSGPPLAPSTCAANDGSSRSRSTPCGVSVTRRTLRSTRCGRLERPRCDRLAVAAGVPGNPTDGHVDAETGSGALFFGLATPEPSTRGDPVPIHDTGAARRSPGRRCGLAPRGPRASGRSPGGAKNKRLCPWQDASEVQVSGPVKTKLETVSAAMARSVAASDRSGGPVGEPTPPLTDTG